jgi:hypothetical protein
VTAPWGRTHRTHFTAPLEIRVRNAIGGCPDLGQFGSALRDNYDLYHMFVVVDEGPSAMITMGKPFRPCWRHHRTLRAAPKTTIYRVADRLHEGRTVDVPCHQIVTTVSAWLAELGAHSPLVEDLGRAVHVGDWPAAYAIGEYLSVDVTVSA